MPLAQVADDLSAAVSRCTFGLPVTHWYNPLEYARDAHRQYLARFGTGTREVLLLGMNPGPWGMAQTGVPFGEVAAVRDWLGIGAGVERPRLEHPQRPVLGFGCPRSEVSGRRLWGWARGRYGTPERFFERFFVANYCPLVFMEASGRNRTPDKLPGTEREPLFASCDEALRRLVAALSPRWVLGVGRFAEERARAALGEYRGTLGRIPHPSPANPAANRGWEAQVEAALRDLGVFR